MKTNFEKTEKFEKLPVGPTSARPGPMLLMVVSTAVKFVTRSLPSNATVHKDLTERLPKISPQLFKSVKEVLEENKRERHIRGGIATKHKYEQQFKKAVK